MPRQAIPGLARRSYLFTPENLDDLETVRKHLKTERGGHVTDTDVIRVLLRKEAEKISKKILKKDLQ